MPAITPARTIAVKRDGGKLSADEIADFIGGYTRGDIPDYQMSALAMAVYLQGMDGEETACLTEQMLRSGTVLAWPPGRPVVDKHSTGGIGDKVSLILAPLLACCDVRVPMISGRGLGPTGGTLDKLEAIPGFQTNLELDQLQAITEQVGCVICGASAEIAPADRKLYALRDVTATVASIPLITASIMSKKLAEGLDALVLDVKFGSGAFMKSLESARQLADSLVETGRRMGVATEALLTDMNQPLGRMVGNAVEVDESVAALAGRGPGDLQEVTWALAAKLLVQANVVGSETAAFDRLDAAVESGGALDKFREMVARQGGDLDAPRRRASARTWPASDSGFVQAIDGERIGQVVIELGGGRRKLGDTIDHSVGLEMLARIGDQVAAGQPLLHVFCDSPLPPAVDQLLHAAIVIGPQPVPAGPLIQTGAD